MTPLHYISIAIIFIIFFYSSYLISETDTTFGYIFGGFTVLVLIYSGYSIILEKKRKRIIDELISREDYRNIIVAGIEERTTGGKNPKTYYIYFCEDPESKNIYETDWINDITDSTIKTGDVVRLYESHTEKDIYWVDINHREQGKGVSKLSNEAKEMGEESFKEIVEDIKDKKRFKPLYLVFTFGISFLYFLVSAVYDVTFYKNSVQTIGSITKVQKENSRCGSSKHRYDCTIFNLNLELQNLPKNEVGLYRSVFIYNVYSVSEKDQPLSLSKYQKGDDVDILIEKNHFNDWFLLDGVKIKQNLLNEIYSSSLFSLITGIITLIFYIWYLYQKITKKVPEADTSK